MGRPGIEHRDGCNVGVRTRGVEAFLALRSLVGGSRGRLFIDEACFKLVHDFNTRAESTVAVLDRESIVFRLSCRQSKKQPVKSVQWARQDGGDVACI